MEPVRRAALVDATIDCIGRAGSLDVTVSQIAKTAGMSSALAHHYFGTKEQIFLSAMRHLLGLYGQSVRTALRSASTPRDRLDALVRANFDTDQFSRPVVSAWLNFYVQAHLSTEAQRLLSIYQNRLRSNLLSCLRPLIGARAEAGAEMLAAQIDGLYIRSALRSEMTDPKQTQDTALDLVALLVGDATTEAAIC